MKNITLFLMISFFISSCNRQEGMFLDEDNFDEDFLINEMDASNLFAFKDTNLTVRPDEPLEPLDPLTPTPPRPPLGGFGHADVNGYYNIEGVIHLSGSGQILSGFLDTEVGIFDDEYIFEIDPPFRQTPRLNYRVEHGVIYVNIDRSWFYTDNNIVPNIPELPEPVEFIWIDPFENGFNLHYKDKNPTMYHSGKTYMAFWREFYIKIFFVLDEN